MFGVYRVYEKPNNIAQCSPINCSQQIQRYIWFVLFEPCIGENFLLFCMDKNIIFDKLNLPDMFFINTLKSI